MSVGRLQAVLVVAVLLALRVASSSAAPPPGDAVAARAIAFKGVDKHDPGLDEIVLR